MGNLRKYGSAPYKVVVIHGGPGAPGELAPVAKELSTNRGVLEPLLTSTSIEGQLQELKVIIEEHGDLPVTLVGHSWGAWLSFIFTSRHSSYVRKLILVGSSPFEEEYVERIMKTRLSRLSKEETVKAHKLQEILADPSIKGKNAILSQFGKLMYKADSLNTLPLRNEEIEYQHDVFLNVCKEASDLRKSGKLLDMGKKIVCPVIAVHGDYDPHPFFGVEKPLSQTVKDFRLVLLEKCGHDPWAEREARNRFYKILEEELR